MQRSFNKPYRRSIRLRGYDYSQPGAYYVTICTQNRKCLFGEVVGDEMVLSEAGSMILAEWMQLPQRFPTIELGASIVMPNHFHGIVVLTDISPTVEAGLVPAGAPLVGAPTLGDVVGAFKSITTNAYIRGVRERDWSPFDQRLWQRNYFEHIIRNEVALNRIRAYIEMNPARWTLDRHNPNAEGTTGFVR